MKLKEIKPSFIKQWAGDVIFGRGQEYFECDMVEELKYNPEEESLSAEVSGSYGDYDVKILIQNNTIEANCSCPYDGYPCKHMVAVLLTFIHRQRKYTCQASKNKKETEDLENKIANLSKQELVKMVCAAFNKYPDFKRDLIVRFSENKKATADMLLKQIKRAFPSITSQHYSSNNIAKELKRILSSIEDTADQMKIKILWAVTKRTLDELNEYGMNDEPMEEVVIDSMKILVGIFKKDKSLTESRQNIIKALLDYYTHNNCGLGDFIYDKAQELCLETSDYKIIIGKLEKELPRTSSKSYYQSLLSNLYDAIGDVDSRQKVLESHLEYGMDYWRLAEFWIEQNDPRRALDVVKKGIELGEGRKTELYAFLQKHYEKEKDYARVFEMLKIKIAKKDLDPHEDYNHDATYQCLWKHYASKNNYDGCKKLLELRLADQNIELDFYKQAMQILNSKDRIVFEKKLIDQLKDGIKKAESSRWYWAGSSIEEKEKLAEIYAHKKESGFLFETIKNDNQLLAKYESKLLSRHPEVYLKRYNDVIQQLIANRGRENYQIVAQRVKGIKKIYNQVLKKPREWDFYISDLKNKNRMLRALKEELAKQGM